MPKLDTVQGLQHWNKLQREIAALGSVASADSSMTLGSYLSTTTSYLAALETSEYGGPGVVPVVFWDPHDMLLATLAVWDSKFLTATSDPSFYDVPAVFWMLHEIMSGIAPYDATTYPYPSVTDRSWDEAPVIPDTVPDYLIPAGSFEQYVAANAAEDAAVKQRCTATPITDQAVADVLRMCAIRLDEVDADDSEPRDWTAQLALRRLANIADGAAPGMSYNDMAW